MKKLRLFTALALALALLTGLCAAQAAQTAYDYGSAYDYLIGAMEVVNCQSWTSLRSYPDTDAPRLMRVPLGAWVSNCYYQDEKPASHCANNSRTF